MPEIVFWPSPLWGAQQRVPLNAVLVSPSGVQTTPRQEAGLPPQVDQAGPPPSSFPRLWAPLPGRRARPRFLPELLSGTRTREAFRAGRQAGGVAVRSSSFQPPVPGREAQQAHGSCGSPEAEAQLDCERVPRPLRGGWCPQRPEAGLGQQKRRHGDRSEGPTRRPVGRVDTAGLQRMGTSRSSRGADHRRAQGAVL